MSPDSIMAENMIIEDDFSKFGLGPDGLKKGPWTAEEDEILVEYVRKYGEGKWNLVQKNTGLPRCGKSCRLRWTNHLRPDLKKGAFTREEEALVIKLHAEYGNKWARMATKLPGRTDNEIKNFWNTRIKRRMKAGLPLHSTNLILLNRQNPTSIGKKSAGGPINSNQSFNSLLLNRTNSSSYLSEDSEALEDSTTCEGVVKQRATSVSDDQACLTSDECQTTDSAPGILAVGLENDSKLSSPRPLSRCLSSASCTSYTNASLTTSKDSLTTYKKSRLSMSNEEGASESEPEPEPESKKRKKSGKAADTSDASFANGSKKKSKSSRVKTNKRLQVDTSEAMRKHLLSGSDGASFPIPRLITPKLQCVMDDIFQLFEDHQKSMNEETLSKEMLQEVFDENDTSSHELPNQEKSAAKSESCPYLLESDSEKAEMYQNFNLFSSLEANQHDAQVDSEVEFSNSFLHMDFDQNFSVCEPLPELCSTPLLDSQDELPMPNNSFSPILSHPTSSQGDNNDETEVNWPENDLIQAENYFLNFEDASQTFLTGDPLLLNTAFSKTDYGITWNLSPRNAAGSAFLNSELQTTPRTNVPPCHVWNLGSVPEKNLHVWRPCQKSETDQRGSALPSPKSCVNDKLPVDAFLKVMECLNYQTRV